jgi:predicted tellurium resistance membrane protein TerC
LGIFTDGHFAFDGIPAIFSMTSSSRYIAIQCEYHFNKLITAA